MDNFFLPEFIILGVLFAFQLILTIRTWGVMSKWSRAFSGELAVQPTDVGGMQVISNSAMTSDKLTSRILDKLNAYVNSYRGLPISSSSLSEMVDAEFDLEEKFIENMLPVPLYIGLLATLMGVVSGLWSFMQSSAELTHGIENLLRSVFNAVVVSLFGLLASTVLSMRFNRIRNRVLASKSDFLAFIKNRLLPQLFYSDDSGFNDLSRSMSSLSKTMRDYMETLAGIHEGTVATVDKQQKMLDVVESKGLPSTNLQLLLELEKLLPGMQKFAEYFSGLQATIENLQSITGNIESISGKLSSVEELSQKVYGTVQGMHELQRFLTGHLEKLDSIGQGSLKAVDLIDDSLKNSFAKLQEVLEEQRKSIGRVADDLDECMRKSVDKIVRHFSTNLETHLKNLREFYPLWPDFSQLKNLEAVNQLENLEDIKSILEGIHEKLSPVEGKSSVVKVVGYEKVINDSPSEESGSPDSEERVKKREFFWEYIWNGRKKRSDTSSSNDKEE